MVWYGDIIAIGVEYHKYHSIASNEDTYVTLQSLSLVTRYVYLCDYLTYTTYRVSDGYSIWTKTKDRFEHG